MVTIFVCMFVADVVFVFVACLVAIVLILWRMMTHQYGELSTPAPATVVAAPQTPVSNLGLSVKDKATQQVFNVYDTKHENGKVSFMIYKDNEFKWVDSTGFEPA